jgi:hypothetical protein
VATTRLRANGPAICQTGGVSSAVSGSMPRNLSQALPNTTYHSALVTRTATAATRTAQ